MENKLFLGIKPYSAQESIYLPQRVKETRMLLYMLSKNQATVLCGEAKSGKTSLINAAMQPQMLADEKACAIIFRVPEFHFGDIVLEKQLTSAIREKCQEPTYLDLAMEDDQSLWLAAKKLQAAQCGCAKFYIIIDQLENLLTYGSAARNEFMSAISGLLQGDTPAKYQDKIQKLMFADGPGALPPDKMTLLIDSPKFHALFSISKSQYGDLAQFSPIIRGILQNTIEISPFDIETAKAAIAEIASQPMDGLKQTSIEPGAAAAIASCLAQSGGCIYPGQLRNAVLYLRSAANGEPITQESLAKSQLLEKSWASEAIAMIEDAQQRQNMADFILGEMVLDGESLPLPACQGVASQRYGLSASALGMMTELCVLRRHIGSDSRAYYLPFSSATIRELNSAPCSCPISQRRPSAARAAHAAAFVSQAATYTPSRHYKALAAGLASSVIVLMAFILLAFSLKSDVEREANASKSNMLAARSFQKLDTDPTLSLRLAQKAVRLDSSNIQAYSALLNAYYNTDIFYDICGEVEGKIAKAEISADCNHILAYIKNDDAGKYAARILNTEGYVILEVPHKSEVTSITLLGDKVLTTSYDSTARVFDINGKMLACITGHKAILWTGDISADGKHILTAGSDCNLMMWSMEGKLEATFKGHDWDVYSAKFSPDGQMVLSSSGDNTARIWSIDGKPIKVLEINEDNRFSQSIVSQAVFSPSGKYILMAANDRLNINHRARLWDIDGKELVTIGGHKDFINSVGFSPDESKIITTSRDKIVRVFSIQGRLEKELKGHGSNVWCAMFMPDSQSITTVGDDNTIRQWTIGKRFECFSNASNVSCATFSPSGLNLIVVQDSVAQLWDLTGSEMAAFKGHHSAINKARFSPNGKCVITSAKDGSVFLWDINGNIISKFTEHGDEVFDGVFSPDGKRIATVSCGSSIIIRDLESGHTIKAAGHEGCVDCVCFAPDGKSIATGGSDGRIIIHDLEGNEIRSFQAHNDRVNSVNFSPNGKNIISTSNDETAVLWDNIGQMLYTFKGYENKVNSAIFSPDGKYILTTSDDGSARMWTTSGMEVMNFKHDGMVSDAVFSPDGRHVITIYRNSNGIKTLKLYMLKSSGITMRIDEKALSGSIYQPDVSVLRKYGVE